MTSPESRDIQRLSLFLELEAMARDAESEKALQFLMVNESRRLLDYQQAVLLRVDRGKHRAETAASLAELDRDAPFVGWLEALSTTLAAEAPLPEARQLSADDCPESSRGEWAAHALAHALWIPLRARDGSLAGALWFSRELAFSSAELTICTRLAEVYAHAWQALPPGERQSEQAGRRYKVPAVLLGLALVLALPVRLSAVAPVEVIAKDPEIVSAPMDGVVAEIPLPPGSEVTDGDVLFRYEDTALRNAFEIAEQALQVARARLRQASQGAFSDEDSRARVALLRQEVELKQTERDYAAELLGRVDVRAKRPGILIYSGKSDWVGRPVQVGERIMEVANPASTQLRIDLPVDDALVLATGAEVKVFLDIAPLKPLTAEVSLAHYTAAPTAAGILAYPVYAAFSAGSEATRIGLQGSARVYGERVSLFFFLFRRPISALRQFLGW